MAYVPPGTYIEEKTKSGGVAAGGFVIPCIVGKGSTKKRYWDELVTRGVVTLEAITPNGSGAASLAYNSNQKKSTSLLYKNSQVLPDDAYAFTAANEITIALAYRDVSATWELTYLAINLDLDDLTTTPLEVIYVSKSPGGARPYKLGTDYQITNGDVDWSTATPASKTGVLGPFDLSSLDKIKISVDGKTPITVTLTGALQSEVTAQEVIDDINAAALAAWGTSYGAIATLVHYTSFDAGAPKITSVVEGSVGRINFYAPASADATELLFDVVPPAYYIGVGVVPAVGADYYVRYDAARPAEEYNTIQLHYRYDDAVTALGPINRSNDLLIAAEIAYLNGAQVLATIQVHDSDDDGIYMYADWVAAIQAVKNNKDITELIVLDTNEDVIGYAVDVIDDEASLLVGHGMGGWFGCASAAAIGDPDTAGTIVYRARQTLQVAASSPGRGRLHLIDPAGMTYQIIETDTQTVVELTLDGPFAAAGVAGMVAGLTTISDSLLRRQLVGFIPSSNTRNKDEAAYLANYGVIAFTNEGGRLVCFDPVTTDAGGDEIYVEPNVRPQKDYVAKRLKQRLDSYVIGIVPDDLGDFLYELKSQIALEINGAISDGIIGAFRDDTGRSRPIDMEKDLKVFQSQVKKTEYKFVYYIMAKYVAKRIYGEYSVDSPIL